MSEFHARDHAINVSASPSAHRLICCPLWPHSVSRIRIYANSFDGLTFGVRFNFPLRQRLPIFVLRLFSVFFIVYWIWCCGPLFYRLTYSNESRATATGKNDKIQLFPKLKMLIGDDSEWQRKHALSFLVLAD